MAGFAPSLFEAEFGRHIALTFPRAEFDDLKRRLVAHGATLIEPERAAPFVRFFFRDPNGYVFEVVDAGRLIGRASDAGADLVCDQRLPTV